tara:strand:+ start:2743 stop:3084 length:342 start_codon:yes stop_codon:yes gene_type:complete
MNVGRALLILVGLLFLGIGYCSGQIQVSHFNSEWNSENDFDISELKECETEIITICESPELKEKHKIMSVPTIIIFDEGIEIKRFEANIMMQLACKLKEIQKEIDKILLAKFE